MSLENSLNNLTDELRRRRGVSDSYNSDSGGSSYSDTGSYGDHEHYDDEYDDHHDDCIDADGDGHCDNDDD